ncbi:MAG: S9 family peptidase [Breznakibacter sp.]
MNRIKLSFLLLLTASILTAQKKPITLDQLWSFTPKRINGIVSMADGMHYTVIGNNGRAIEKIEYATGKKVADLVDLSKIENCKIETIEGYEINSTETRILLYTNSEKIYRHSFKADYYLYDIRYKELKPLSDKGKQRVACFSPDGDHVAYVHNNNIYLAKLRFNTESAVTSDGKTNAILNGVPDWVYEEEFSMDKALEWSPDSKEIAYIRFDESAVKEYSFPLYRASFPSYDDYLLYPGQYTYKYPKSGEANSKVSVQVFNIDSRTTKTMQTGTDDDIYLPRIKWTPQPGQLGIMKLNRRQNQFDLIIANTATTLSNSVFTDRNESYISEDVLNNFQFLPDGTGFVYLGEMDGYSHLYHFSMAGRKLLQLTKGDFDVTAFLGYDPSFKLFYYQAASVSPMQREIYVTGTGGKNTLRLSKDEGTHNAVFSTTCKYYVNTFSSTQTPSFITVNDAKGKQLRILEDNAALKNRCNDFLIAPKEFIKIPLTSATLNGWMVKPTDFDASKKYPVLVIQYSGPNSQQVVDNWKIGWEQYLATQGYIVVSIDPRGTGARGEVFRKCTYMKLGKIESDDMIEAARYLGSLPYVDAGRLGIWGWSFGGYMTLQCLSKSDVFKMGISVAPVTNWRFYDTVYTERFMRRPQENTAGYDDNSPINTAKNLNGKLLLVHGTADDNVHFQNSMEYVDRLVQEGKQFDMFVYPNRNHSIYGGKTNTHIYNMMANYVKKNL